ncbi:hypothetical protein BaRGS_00039304, partial [Batillaria attramentaria]
FKHHLSPDLSGITTCTQSLTLPPRRTGPTLAPDSRHDSWQSTLCSNVNETIQKAQQLALRMHRRHCAPRQAFIVSVSQVFRCSVTARGGRLLSVPFCDLHLATADSAEYLVASVSMD